MKVFHHRFFKPLGLAVFIGASMLLNTGCTKKSSTSSTPTPAAPTVSLTEPVATYAETTDSVTVGGKVTDAGSVGITSVVVNTDPADVAVTATIANDSFTVKLKVTADTMKVIATLTAADGQLAYDTVTVYRTPSSIVTGMSKISGTLLKEASSRDLGAVNVNMLARNAEGRQKMVRSVVPISGADIMLYDANSVSTSSDTSVTTDSAGGWAVELAPANYFVFAVYFDRTNLEIVTAGLPNIEAIVDKETKTDSATAISDDVKPMLLTFLDASEANSSNTFLASDVPENLPIVMTFSEVMTRVTAGDSISGVVLGKTNPDSSDLPMLDTIPVKKLWGPNGKELRLKPSSTLTVGATYKVIIPTSLKDLALNKLDNTYYGIFTVISAVSLPDFAVTNSSPKSGDTIPAGFPVEVIFSRPIDMISLNKNFAMTSSSTRQDEFKGYFEGKGKIARFINTTKWAYGTPYTLTIDGSTKDLLGDSLGTTAYSLTFHIAAQDTFEQKEGVEGQVAAAINKFLGAYVAGDIETFGLAFHNNFEMIDVRYDGTEERMQRDKFLEERRDDIEQQNRYSKIGFLAPKFYYPEISGTRYVCWKLTHDSTVYFQDLGHNGGYNQVPKVFNAAKTLDISSFVQYVDRGIVYGGDTLLFSPDWSKAFVDEDSRENDEGFFGRLLKDETHVETQSILLETKTTFFIKSISKNTSGDTVSAMIELTTERKFANGVRPYPIEDPTNPPPDVEKYVMAIQTQLIVENGKWFVIQMVAKELFSGDMAQFHADSVNAGDFEIKHFEHTQAIELVKPPQKGINITAPITFEWSVPSVRGTIGGYLVGISNEMSGGNQGLLMYTKQTKIVIDSNGTVDSNTTILNIDPMSLHVPMPNFGARLTSFKASDSAIYVWKVAAISDTSASDVSNNAFKVSADSDFGSSMGPGFFTMLGEMPDIQNMVNHDPMHQGPMDDQFMDSDGDNFPDYFERAFKTDPFDPGSFPDFRVDTDLDGYSDFMEGLAGTISEDKTSVPTDANGNKIWDDLEDPEKNPDWRPHLAMDDDGDGFPTEYEFIFGSDPWNPNSKPEKMIKPMAPTGTYYAGVKFGDGPDGTVEKMYMRISSDTTGDFVNVDSTHIKGLAKGGSGLNLKLYFQFGEFVCYLPIVDGMNAGKFIKIRFMSHSTAEGMVLDGPVDMADMEPGGGPYIGRFAASTDSAFDPSSWFSGGPLPMGPGPNDGELHLPPPPEELMTRPDSALDMSLKLVFDTVPGNHPVVATIIADGKTMVDSFVFWGPGNWPALGFKWDSADAHLHIDGNLHKKMINQDTPDSTKDILVLTGFYNAQVGNEYHNFEFVLKHVGFKDPRKPVGTWVGWLFRKQMDPNMGPLPFIGTAEAVQAALTATDSNAIIAGPEGPSAVKKIELIRQQASNIWEAKVVGGDDWFYIMEQPGDWEHVFIEDINSQKVIILAPIVAGEHDGPPPPFNGDSMVVVNALTGSNNTIVEFGPSGPVEVVIDPLTLGSIEKEGEPGVKVGWAVAEAGVTTHIFIFMADKMNPDRLQFENGNKPAVFRHDLPPQGQPQ